MRAPECALWPGPRYKRPIESRATLHEATGAAEARWSPPELESLDCTLDIAAGMGMNEAVVQSTQIGAVNSWLRNQPEEVVSASVASIREALSPHADGNRVCLPAAIWLVRSTPN